MVDLHVTGLRNPACVQRFDSMNKILSTSMRLGWITGPKQFDQTDYFRTLVTKLQPSSISQAIAMSSLSTGATLASSPT
ncbi:hypothetical protein BC936DRAFT_147690 [Jimgerdemannia flammicorona]|uniref:Uncharacterized protein n=1 Tax=Jimgerdemannia flammicorona TaxID=994334 RepID=A0A433D4S1_9FUNG|nr:hypothetical protein BC936DRAFT_147690 [Jimgerdemannia flammicorona]